MDDLTSEQRLKLRERLASLDERAAAIKKAAQPFEDQLRPFQQAMATIEDIKEELLADAGVELVGNCETCDMILFSSDHGHHCSDGPILCAACSPTWRDLLAQYSEPGAAEAAEDAEAFEAGRALAQAEVDAGNGDRLHIARLG